MSFSTKAAGKMIKQLAGNGAGQSLMDRVTQAKYGIAGSALGKTVAKATTVEHSAPKSKHLDYLINCSNEPNVSIPLLAALLIERLQEKQWSTAFKTLITIHNLMNFGNEKFSQYLASNNCPINQPNFNDKTTARSYEMSLYIRKYSSYLEEKTQSYRTMAFDFCKVKRSREDGVLRLMPADKLLKALPVLEKQILTLLDFDATEKDLDNAIINAAFVLLYKDLIRLFASYNEGMINLIEKYFKLKRKNCKLALDLYVRFTDLMNKVTEFMKTAEKLGIGDKDCLGLVPVPEKVIKAMKQHMKLLNKKHGKDDEEEVEEKETKKPAPAVAAVPKETPQAESDKKKAKKADKKASSSEEESSEEEDTGLPDDMQKEIIATTLENLDKPKINIIHPSPYIHKKKPKNVPDDSASSSSSEMSEVDNRKAKKKEASSSVFEDSFADVKKDTPKKKKGKEASSEEESELKKSSKEERVAKKKKPKSDEDSEKEAKKKKKSHESDCEGSEAEKKSKKHKKKKKHDSDEEDVVAAAAEEAEKKSKKKHKKKTHESESEAEAVEAPPAPEEEEKKSKKKHKKKTQDSESEQQGDASDPETQKKKHKKKSREEAAEDEKKSKKNKKKKHQEEEERSNDEEKAKKKKKSKKKSRDSSEESEEETVKKSDKKAKSHFDDLIDLDFLGSVVDKKAPESEKAETKEGKEEETPDANEEEVGDKKDN